MRLVTLSAVLLPAALGLVIPPSADIHWRSALPCEIGFLAHNHYVSRAGPSTRYSRQIPEIWAGVGLAQPPKKDADEVSAWVAAIVADKEKWSHRVTAAEDDVIRRPEVKKALVDSFDPAVEERDHVWNRRVRRSAEVSSSQPRAARPDIEQSRGQTWGKRGPEREDTQR